MRKVRTWTGRILLAAVLYLMIGAMAPFWVPQKMSAEQLEAIDTASFYGESVSVDSAMILETNESAWEERIRLIRQAEERIILSTFDMRPQESTKDILAVLYERAEAGVQIQILVDGLSGFLRMEGDPLFYAASSHPNIEIRLYNPVNLLKPWTTQGRMHDKYLLVDDVAYILGGRNMFDYFIGSYPTDHRSHDREVLIYNRACSRGKEESMGEARERENIDNIEKDGRAGNGRETEESSWTQIEDYFASVWNSPYAAVFHDSPNLAQQSNVQEQTAMLQERVRKLKEEYPELFEGDGAYEERTVPVNQVTLVSNPIGIYGKEPVVFETLCRLMKEDGGGVIIHTPYVVLDKKMQERLTEVTQSQIPITLMTNSVENGDNFFGSSDYIRNKGKVLETGMTIYEYDGGESYHGKSMAIGDRLAVVGSYNLDLRSTYVDTELMLVIDSAEICAQLTGYMEELQEDARRVIDEDTYETPEHIEVQAVPWWKRLAWEVVGRLMIPFRVLI